MSLARRIALVLLAVLLPAGSALSARPAASRASAVDPSTRPVEPIAAVAVDRDHDTVPDRKGEPAKVRATVVVGTGVLRDRGFQVFVQDASGGFNLFNARSSDLTLEPGDVIEAWGEISQYKGAVQLQNAEVRRIGRAAVPPPTPVTTAQVDGWAHVGHRVRVEGIAGAVMLDKWAMLRITGDDGMPLQIYVPAPVVAGFDWKRWPPGTRVAATGVMSIFKPTWPFDGGFQLVVTDPADLAVLEPPPPEWHRWIGWAIAAALGVLALGTLVLYLMQRRQRARQRELSTLSALSAALADTGIGEEQIARNACEILTAYDIVDGVAVHLHDDGQRLQRVAASIADARMRSAVEAASPEGDADVAALSQRLRDGGLRVIGLHRLAGADATLGVLAAFSLRARRPSQMQERTLLAAAKLLAMALQNHRIRERARQEAQALQKLVITDELTRLYNRRFLDEYLRVQLPLAERRGGGLAFVALDIDHFKRINDTYGHEAGDRVLAGIAGQLREASRSCDLPVRLGGEEFLVVIAEHEVDGAMTFAERLREAIAALAFDDVVPDRGLRVTVSIGVALFGVHGTDAVTLMRASDEAMYASKRSGRDRVTLSTTLPALSA
ncbi:diguanylate cyclase [Cognatilysobacter segetis]|uniref:diguanylate cyclase n=1 Tax=Cognatilysobacter segetis TaxID=2492394 RepID=UPI0010622CD2|nr:diguanylate cyclase [Lysobacter segetis]